MASKLGQTFNLFWRSEAQVQENERIQHQKYITEKLDNLIFSDFKKAFLNARTCISICHAPDSPTEYHEEKEFVEILNLLKETEPVTVKIEHFKTFGEYDNKVDGRRYIVCYNKN